MARKSSDVCRDETRIARRNAVGICEIDAIVTRWGLSADQTALLLGTPLHTYLQWRQLSGESEELELSDDVLIRLSCLLGISVSLQMLFPTESNRILWLKNPNTGHLFNGQAPLDRMLNGDVAALLTVRQMLDDQRG